MASAGKTEWPFPVNIHSSMSWRISSAIIKPMVFGLAKVTVDFGILNPRWIRRLYADVMLSDHFYFRFTRRYYTLPLEWLNRTTVYNSEGLIDHVEKLYHGGNRTPLITVCNHRSCLDDPLIWGALLKWRHIVRPGVMRWTPAAAEICFTNRYVGYFFGSGHCVPVERGEGVYQKGVDFCLDRLNECGWVHLFPEGKVNLDDYRRLKWGIGRLIAECNVVPEIIPLWMVGMDDVLPNKEPYIPRVRQRVTVYVGEPMNLRDILLSMKTSISDPTQLRKQITDVIEVGFWNLKERAEALHYAPN